MKIYARFFVTERRLGKQVGLLIIAIQQFKRLLLYVSQLSIGQNIEMLSDDRENSLLLIVVVIVQIETVSEAVLQY
jgi:hypothetical protein